MATNMNDMWVTASGNSEDELQNSLVLEARLEASSYWPVLAAAQNPQDFQNRLALIDDQITSVARKTTQGNESHYASVRRELVKTLTNDFRTVHEARKQKESARAKRGQAHAAKLQREVLAELSKKAADHPEEWDTSIGDKWDMSPDAVAYRAGRDGPWRPGWKAEQNAILDGSDLNKGHLGTRKNVKEDSVVVNGKRVARFQTQAMAVNFTRQDFNHIAETIRTAPVDEETRESLAKHFADQLASTNANFNRDRFVGASTHSASRHFLAGDYQGDRAAKVNGGASLEQVQNYMPSNYTASQDSEGTIWISGHDEAGWTLDGYVIPRLGSGLISATEIPASAAAFNSTASRKVAEGPPGDNYDDNDWNNYSRGYDDGEDGKDITAEPDHDQPYLDGYIDGQMSWQQNVMTSNRKTAGPSGTSRDTVGYTYDADVHCPACAIARFGQEPGRYWVKEDAEDSEGNPVHPIASWDESSEEGDYCGTCGGEINSPWSKEGSRKVAADPGWTSNDPDWWENKNKGGYGMPNNHPFWSETPHEDIGQWRVFEKDGTWYAMNRNQNAWFKPSGDRQTIVDYVSKFNDNPIDIWASRKVADTSTCTHCGTGIHTVPGGQGPTWVDDKGYAACFVGPPTTTKPSVHDPGRAGTPGATASRKVASYKIIRFKQNGPNRVIDRGLTLEEAQAHCQDETTHGEGWFDGYDEE